MVTQFLTYIILPISIATIFFGLIWVWFSLTNKKTFTLNGETKATVADHLTFEEISDLVGKANLITYRSPNCGGTVIPGQSIPVVDGMIINAVWES